MRAKPRAALGAAPGSFPLQEPLGEQKVPKDSQAAANEKCKPYVSKGETRWRPVLFLGIHYMPACPEKGDKEDMCKRFAVLLTFEVVNQRHLSSFKAVPGQKGMC